VEQQQPQYGAAPNSGQSLKNLCTIAGASLMVAGVLYVWAFVAQFILPAPGPQTEESFLQYIASYRSFFIISYALFTAANSLSIVGAMGIYVVTRVVDRSYAILGAGTLVVGFTVTLLSSTAPALLRLSDAYSAATNVVDQQALAIAAEAVSSTNNPLVASSFIGVGVIFVSLAMKGAFGRWLPYLGLFVGALNIVRALPFLAGYSLIAAVFVGVSSIWIVGVGRRIYRTA
jgi:hypothetical protein